MAADLDLLSLAEDVAAGRRTLDNVIDQIAVATPDDRKRRDSVAELQALVVGLTGVRAHARATVETPAREAAAADRPLTVAPGPVGPPGPVRRVSLGPVLAGGASLAVGILVLVVAIGVLRPAASVGGPSPSAQPASPVSSASGAVSASGSTTPPGSTAPSVTAWPSGAASPSPVPTAQGSLSPSASGVPSTPASSAPSTSIVPSVVPSAPAPSPSASPSVPSATMAFWSFGEKDGTLDLWTWAPAVDTALHPAMQIETWSKSGATIEVIVSPDGRRVAVNEYSVTSQSLNRTRVFDAAGALLWTSPSGSAPVVDLVWSPDSTALALGAVPSPWTVVVFSPGGSIDATTYDVSGDRAYRLLGFAPDDAHLVGYESSGEADFWESPVSLDLAHGAVVFTPLLRFPAGMQSNGSTARSLDRINPASGDVLTISGGAKGPPEWALQSGSTETPFGLDLSSTMAWTDATTIAVVASIDPPGTLELSTTAGPGDARLPVTTFVGPSIPSQGQAAPVALDGVHDGLVLVATGALFGQGAGGQEGVMLVDVRSGVSMQLPMQQGADVPHLNFAGWVEP